MPNVYYAVGQNTSDHKSGTSPTVDITDGVATFSEAQTATNLGVGDRVTYSGTSYCFLASKVTTSQWNVVTRLGAAPTNTGGYVTLNSIAHDYTSMSLAEAGANDAAHLGTLDLTSGSYVLYFPCYNDAGAADTTALIVSGWTTSASYFMQYYTPASTSTECNQRQRHSGLWDDARFRFVRTITASNQQGIAINDNHVRLIGLQCELVVGASNTNTYMIHITTVEAGADCLVDSCLIKMSGASGTSNSRGITLYDADLKACIRNCVIYDFVNGTTACAGIYLRNVLGGAYIYNNITYNCYNGHILSSGSPIAVNNIFDNCNTNTSGTYAAGTRNNATDDASIGYTVTGGSVEDRVSQTFSYVAEGTDFHLTSSDAGARNYGYNLSSASDYPFDWDVDGETRPGEDVWDIGPDEYISGVTYKSFAVNMSVTADMANPLTAQRPLQSAASILATLEALLRVQKPIAADMAISADMAATFLRLRRLQTDQVILVSFIDALSLLRRYGSAIQITADFAGALTCLRHLKVEADVLANMTVTLSLAGVPTPNYLPLAIDFVADANFTALLSRIRTLATSFEVSGDFAILLECLRSLQVSLDVDVTCTAALSIIQEYFRNLSVAISVSGNFLATLSRVVPLLATFSIPVDISVSLSKIGEVVVEGMQGRTLVLFGPQHLRRLDRRREHAFLRKYR